MIALEIKIKESEDYRRLEIKREIGFIVVNK